MLGWTERETLDTSIPAIERAFEGRLRVLNYFPGSPFYPPKAQEERKPPAGKDILAVFRMAASGPKR